MIIDAHIHFSSHEGFRETARAAGHENSAEHLAEAFRANGVAAAVAMGAGSGGDDPAMVAPMLPDLAGPGGEPPPFIYHCCGLTSEALTRAKLPRTLDAFARALAAPRCVGLKLYCGYSRIYVNDPLHHGFFELAESLDVPVVIHTGDTANARGVLKYAHPLNVDEAAVNFPRVRFVMAHYGNPWIVDATAVAAKNPNVCIDLSGLAAGTIEPDDFCARYRGYLDHIRTWMEYLGDYEKLLYGSDWPLVGLAGYIEVIRRLVPEAEHDKVFCLNALRVFPKLSPK